MHPTAARLYEAARELRDLDGPSAVARLLNESPQTMNNWEKRGVSQKGAIKAQAEIGCSATWLTSGEGEMLAAAPQYAVAQSAGPSTRFGTPTATQSSPTAAIPQYDTGGSMGSGLLLRDQPGVIRGFNVTREWLDKNLPYYTSLDNLAIVTGFGDSMQGMFNPGDPLIVDCGIKRADVDGVYFFRVGDEGFIKRLQRIPGQGVLVISENAKYRDWTITPDMDMAVMGKVLKAWQGVNL
jgi:phage repressor protein C with HTH and peptisase S24 domain